MRTEIIYQDNDIVVIYKPAGLATQTARVGQPDVVSELKNALKTSYLGVISRLDQPVEGLLVFARTKEAAAALTHQLETGVLRKHYYAVVCGKPAEPQGCYVDYLTKTRENTAEVYPERGKRPAEAKRAVLHYTVAGQCVKPHPAEIAILTLLDVTIDTGRFHQIRAQLAAHGLPLLGDRKYGTPESLALTQEKQISSVALCAWSLELRHPTTGRELSWRITPQAAAFAQFLQSENF